MGALPHGDGRTDGSACDATAQKSISIRRVRRRRRSHRVRFRLGLGGGRRRNEMKWELGAGRDILTRRKKDRRGLGGWWHVHAMPRTTSIS